MTRTFSTGSVRDSREGKGRYDLISPFAMRRLARRCEEGAKKYGDRNWEKGQNLSAIIDSTQRHIDQIKMGDTSEDHPGAAFWGLMAFIHTQEMIDADVLPKELDDLPKYVKGGTNGQAPSKAE